MTDLSFPPFDLYRLIESSFEPEPGERLAILIDLPEPSLVENFRFLDHPEFELQALAYNDFYQPLRAGVAERLKLGAVDFFAYRTVSGSNAELPHEAFTPAGQTIDFVDDICSKYTILMCLTTHSATAPLLVLSRKTGFRAATMHGINRDVMNSGLCLDYRKVGEVTNRFKAALSPAERAEIDFTYRGQTFRLDVEFGGRHAGKSAGRCPPGFRNVENLPDGEIYFLPKSAHGVFPHKFPDGTLAALKVDNGSVVDGTLLDGNPDTLAAGLQRFIEDPASAVICEFGLGTSRLPVTGVEIQDEKIFGTFHLATGRCDHLGGYIGPEAFRHLRNATHDDHLYNLGRTPEIGAQVRLVRAGRTDVLIDDYVASPLMEELLDDAVAAQ
jgi:hypothetical protein